jgi:hypothetical protein
MSSCIPRKYLQSVNVYGLDECGRVQVGAGALFGLSLRTIVLAEAIEEGEEETVTDVYGNVCVQDKACPIDRGTDFTMTDCVENWSLNALLGFGTLHTTLGVVDGFDRNSVNCDAAVAVELVWKPGGACAAGVDPKCLVQLFPHVRNWTPTGEQTVDAKNTVSRTFKGRTYKNGRLFQDVVPAQLSHWTPFAAEIAAGNTFSYTRTMDCPVQAAPSCELVPLTA